MVCSCVEESILLAKELMVNALYITNNRPREQLMMNYFTEYINKQ